LQKIISRIIEIQPFLASRKKIANSTFGKSSVGKFLRIKEPKSNRGTKEGLFRQILTVIFIWPLRLVDFQVELADEILRKLYKRTVNATKSLWNTGSRITGTPDSSSKNDPKMKLKDGTGNEKKITVPKEVRRRMRVRFYTMTVEQRIEFRAYEKWRTTHQIPALKQLSQAFSAFQQKTIVLETPRIPANIQATDRMRMGQYRKLLDELKSKTESNFAEEAINRAEDPALVMSAVKTAFSFALYKRKIERSHNEIEGLIESLNNTASAMQNG